MEFAKKFSVIGFDINQERVDMMKNRIDPSEELEAEAFDNKDILFTTNTEDLRDAHFLKGFLCGKGMLKLVLNSVTVCM